MDGLAAFLYRTKTYLVKNRLRRMFEHFASYLRETADLAAEELAAVRAVSIEKRLRRKQYLLQEGEVCHHNCFIIKGCLRLYRVSDDGVEHILRFGVENWWISDHESYNTGNLSKSNIDALENCELILVEKQDFEYLKERIPSFKAFIERLKARSFDASQNRIMSDISFTAEEKYQNFLISFPHIFNRVPLHMIASYLGLSRETLSRVRNSYMAK
jgi:CRP-like cAMP-binding protein